MAFFFVYFLWQLAHFVLRILSIVANNREVSSNDQLTALSFPKLAHIVVYVDLNLNFFFDKLNHGVFAELFFQSMLTVWHEQQFVSLFIAIGNNAYLLVFCVFDSGLQTIVTCIQIQ